MGRAYREICTARSPSKEVCHGARVRTSRPSAPFFSKVSFITIWFLISGRNTGWKPHSGHKYQSPHASPYFPWKDAPWWAGDEVAVSVVVTKVFLPNFDTSGVFAFLSLNAKCAQLLLYRWYILFRNFQSSLELIVIAQISWRDYSHVMKNSLLNSCYWWIWLLNSSLNVNVPDDAMRKGLGEHYQGGGFVRCLLSAEDKPRLEIFIGSVLQQHGINCLRVFW